MSYSLGDRSLFLLARWLLRLLAATWRIREVVPDECRSILVGEELAVIAFWHGGMLPVWFRFRKRGAAALISSSRDGEILARYLDSSLGYQVIRGSSSRGGGEALASVVKSLENRSCLITPDGPRGPARQAKAGALIAAQRSGRRVLLAGWHSNRCWKFGSWDSMAVPIPFGQVEFRYCIFDLPHHTQSTSTTANAECHPPDQWIDNDELARFSETLDTLY
jgi:lysophospholipid acyltransferase (LPLAT)-like uncharacterized protein